MKTLKTANRSVELDDEGCLADFNDWSREVAQALAFEEGISDLTDAHMQVLELIRNYYRKHNIAPMIHLLARECGKTYRELHYLFKKQPGKRAAKLAGLPKSKGCV